MYLVNMDLLSVANDIYDLTKAELWKKKYLVNAFNFLLYSLFLVNALIFFIFIIEAISSTLKIRELCDIVQRCR